MRSDMIKAYRHTSHKSQFIDNGRFTSSSFSHLVNNRSERINEVKCEYGQDDKQCQTFRIKSECCNCFLQYTGLKDDLIEYKCLYLKKNYKKSAVETKRKDLFIRTNFLWCIYIYIYIIYI